MTLRVTNKLKEFSQKILYGNFLYATLCIYVRNNVRVYKEPRVRDEKVGENKLKLYYVFVCVCVYVRVYLCVSKRFRHFYCFQSGALMLLLRNIRYIQQSMKKKSLYTHNSSVVVVEMKKKFIVC